MHVPNAQPCDIPAGADSIQVVPTWYRYLPGESIGGGKCLPHFSPADPADYVRILLAIFEIVLRIGGMVAVVFVIYGGFLYLTSAGEPEKAKNGRTAIINALIGLAVTMSATAIVNLVGRNL